jgi:GT2 family glycosyltransferase
MSAHPTLSVVIVSWNATKYLEECLTSLDEARYPWPIEVIVVDNASADDSSRMVQRLFPDVILIQNSDNLGFSKANNIGIRRSTGKYIALVNSDVHVLANCLEKLVDYLESEPGTGMTGPKIIGGDGRQQNSHRGFPRLWNMLCRAVAVDRVLPGVPLFSGYLLKSSVIESPTPVDILSGCFLVVRRSALDDIGLLDEAFFIYGEDMDWCKRFWRANQRVMFFPAAESIHYGGASSANAPLRFFVEMQRADLQYWRKHHSRIAVALYVAFSVLHHLIRIVGHRAAAVVVPEQSSSHLHRAKCSSVCLEWMMSNLGARRDLAHR